VIDAAGTDENVQAIRRFNELLAKDDRLEATALQLVGAKGWDGMAFAVVR
jgi:predicted O-methyltransferase YrrM